MPFHRCTICQPDGTVIVKDITVALVDPEEAGGVEWHGTLTITHLTTLAPGQRYQLVLDDGRAGEFVVRRNTFAGDVQRAVAIHGAGPLR